MEQLTDFSKPTLIQLPKITDARGNLSFLQNSDQIPFVIQRVFWIYDVPGGEKRGGHAFINQQEVIIVLSGSLDIIVVDPDGIESKFCLNRSYFGLYIPPLHWRHLENFSTNSVSVHLSDSEFSESDYIRNYEQFKNLK
ncbi:MAG: WxcM-like domain-containing protein [Burkholderiales bacterium]|nr:WxcM-like domain-containing protein [Flavobacterium sp.]